MNTVGVRFSMYTHLLSVMIVVKNTIESYIKTYHNIHNTKEIIMDRVEEIKKKYASIKLNDEIDRWFFGDNSEGAENA